MNTLSETRILYRNWDNKHLQHHDFHMGVSPGGGGGSAYEWQAFFMQLGLWLTVRLWEVSIIIKSLLAVV